MDGEYSLVLEQILVGINDVITLINLHGDNIAAGLRFVMYFVGGFFVWMVIRLLYGLFGQVFFKGV